MSKINELRKKAADAARKRDWSGAVKLYEKVCDIDSNNPGFRNELGDIFVKMGQVEQALGAFDKAAEAYRSVGLHNNAVAVYKKILRHDANNLDALWGLGDLKEQQGLQTDAAAHYIDFLARAEEIPGSSRTKFVNRCLLLIERYSDDLQMLSRIETILERWKLGEDHARVLIQKARLALSEGQDELIEKYVARAREVFEDLDLLDDYLLLRREMGGDAHPQDVIEAEDIESTAASEPAAANSGPISRGRTGEIDLGFDLAAGAKSASEHELTEDEFRPNSTVEIDAISAPPAPTPPIQEAPPKPEPIASGSINLLDELLSDDSYDRRADESGQVDTIEADVASQIAGQVADDDYDGQYDVALVYLDMGLYESAIEAFERAARGKEQRLKAIGMRGNVLRQMGRGEDALVAYEDGLLSTGYPAKAYLGLHYDMATCLVELGQLDQALQHFEQAAAIDPNFLDVAARIRQLQTQSAH